MKTLKVCIFILGLCQGVAHAIPNAIIYQGTLKESNVPVNGDRQIQVRLTNSDGSIVYWSSGNMDVNIQFGLFAATLTPTGVDWQNVNPYIELSVNGNTLLPREPMTATAYALMCGGVIDGAIASSKLAPGAVTTASLGSGSVTSAQLAAGAVLTANIADGAVTSTQLAPAAVATSNIAAGAVTSAQLAAAAVNTSNISNGAVTSTQLAPGSVGTSNLAASAVTAAKLAAGAVTNSAIAPGAVSASNLGSDVTPYLIPSGMVAMFTTSCPSGWTRLSALDNAFPMGSTGFGTSGGSTTHSHSLGGPTTIENGLWVFTSPQGSGSTPVNVALADHVHSVSSASNMPPYVTVVWCQKS